MHSPSIEYFLINELNFSISKRQKAEIWINNEKISPEQLIRILKQAKDKSFVYLLCFFDTFSRKNTNYFINKKDYFIQLSSKETNESNKRSLTNIFITMLKFHYNSFSNHQKERITEICFNWLIDDSLIATQCNCLTCLDILTKENKWIKDELMHIIDKNFTHKPPSYQSRAKKIMKKYRSI